MHKLQRLYALSCRGYMLSCRGYIHKLQRLYASYSDNKANSAQFQLGLGLSCRGYMLSCRGYMHKLQRLYAGYSDNTANSAQFQLGLGLSLAIEMSVNFQRPSDKVQFISLEVWKNWRSPWKLLLVWYSLYLNFILVLTLVFLLYGAINIILVLMVVTFHGYWFVMIGVGPILWYLLLVSLNNNSNFNQWLIILGLGWVCVGSSGPSLQGRPNYKSDFRGQNWMHILLDFS